MVIVESKRDIQKFGEYVRENASDLIYVVFFVFTFDPVNSVAM